MKPMALPLAILFVAVGVNMASPQTSGGGGGPLDIFLKILRANSQDEGSKFPLLSRLLGNDSEGERGFGSVLASIIKNLSKIFGSSGGGGRNFRELLEEILEARGLEMPNPREIFLDVIEELCCEDNCTEKARTCMMALKPDDDAKKYHRQCASVAFEAFMDEKNPLEARIRCFGETLFKDQSLGEFSKTNFTSNLITYLEYKFKDNSEVNGTEIISSVTNGGCELPELLQDIQIGDTMKFHACLLNQCIKTIPKVAQES